MRKLVLLLFLLLISAGVYAQSGTPGALVGLLEAGDFRALTVTDDERYLLVADAATNQIRVYELSNLTDPPLLGSVGVEGIPTEISFGRGFALVATETSFTPGTVEIVAPARYSANGMFAAGSNFVDLPFEIQSLVVSSDRAYAAAVGSSRFALLRLRSAEEIDARTFDQSLSAVALADDTLFYAQGAALRAARLNGTSDPEDFASIEANGDISAVAISPNGQVGAFALDDGTIALFDADSLAVLATIRLPSTPILLQFGDGSNTSRLVAAVRGDGRLYVLNIAGGESLQIIAESSLSLDGAIRAIALFTDHVIATDGSTIGIFTLP